MLRTLLRVVGFSLVAVAVFFLFRDLWTSLEAGGWTAVAAGELWYRWHPASLNLAQAAIQRHVLPELWDPWIVGVLLAPASLVLGVVGLLVMALAGRSRG
ncbi:MAG: hypothetical protein SF002_06960 [Alphaproteobacteria bacterium]|nr:hypothetical protein [Alphaproteobacteria bacterium]